MDTYYSFKISAILYPVLINVYKVILIDYINPRRLIDATN